MNQLSDIHKVKTHKVTNPDQLRSYFRLEWLPLSLVTVSGIIYNVGMTAGPYFEGKMTGRLFEILSGEKAPSSMLPLALLYLAVILTVQGSRCVKRFYVRRFANDTSRNMRHMLYNSLVHKSKAELEQESVGAMMTKAISDVDACVEGMRKFTTEIFDTGVVLAAYLVMLLCYDWKLALISCAFTPVAYLAADRLKKTVTTSNAAYKQTAGILNDATLDRVSHAITYRVSGMETARNEAYDKHLTDYEQQAVKASLWTTATQPIYQIISMCGVIPLLYFGAKNVLGTGWTSWDIAAFTTFLSCFTKLAKKSSSAAKLFNAVQKAKVSWKRVKPFLQEYIEPDTDSGLNISGLNVSAPEQLTVSHLSFSYPGGDPVIQDLSFSAVPGEIIGITGPVASGKSTLGKVFLCEHPYQGSIMIGDHELSGFNEYERSQLISYLGHQPELMSASIEENIRLGQPGNLEFYLNCVQFDQEIADMPEGIHTFAGSSGTRLSGGQQARIALARTLYHGRQILILDDPFSAVDHNTECAIMEQIRHLAKHKIVLLISHRLSLFPDFDQVIWLGNRNMDSDCTQKHDTAALHGMEIVSTHAELMKTCPPYRQLFCTQQVSQQIGGESDEA